MFLKRFYQSFTEFVREFCTDLIHVWGFVNLGSKKMKHHPSLFPRARRGLRDFDMDL